MAEHEVWISIPDKAVVNADVEFNVFRDGVKLGRLRVSKGSIDWLPKKKKVGYRLGWLEFDEIMKKSWS